MISALAAAKAYAATQGSGIGATKPMQEAAGSVDRTPP